MMKIPAHTSHINLAKGLFAVFCCLPFALSALAETSADQLVVYPVTEGMPRNNDFTVKVRTPRRNWQENPAYLVKVAQGVDTRPPAERMERSKVKDPIKQVPNVASGRVMEPLGIPSCMRTIPIPK